MSQQDSPNKSANQDLDDLSAWQDELRQVKPLSQRPRAARPPTPDPSAALKQRHAEESRSIMQEAMLTTVEPEEFNTGDEQEFRRGSLPRNTLRKLRRGQFAVQGCLDVHGMRREEAHQATQRFLDTARLQQWRCVKIIHGKGLHSPQGIPILKRRVDITLQRNNDVLAYCSAPNWDGGHGATLVLLKRSQR